jgi:hypothetical protein
MKNMAKHNKLIKDFYELKVNQLMDKRIWDLPVVLEKEDIHNVLSILGAKNHIWVIYSCPKAFSLLCFWNARY